MKSEDVFDAQPLPSLKRLSAGYAMRRIFTKAGPQDRVAYALAMNFIRLVDHAAQSYKTARQSMVDFVNTHDQLAWDEVENSCFHFDLCINSIVRANKMARELGKRKGNPDGLRRCLPRNGKVLPKDLWEPIRKLRNDSQHWEENMMEEEAVSDGKAVALFPDRDTLNLGSNRVEYDLLVEAISLLHPIAEAVSRFREESSQ